MKKNTVEQIQDISLSAKQIKAKLEDSLMYDHEKLRNTNILFATKSQNEKLPFSSFKISVSEEIESQQLLLESLQAYIEETKLIEEKEEIEEYVIEEVQPSEENEISIIEEVCEFDEIDELDEDLDEEDLDEEYDEDEHPLLPYTQRVKRPKGYTIKVVDVAAIIAKIKREGEEKNKGKPVIGRRQINKLLKPYLLRQETHFDIDGIDDTLTSIDIYLNAVDKIASTEPSKAPVSNLPDTDLNLDNILKDLEEK